MRFKTLLGMALIVFIFHNLEEYLTMPAFIENHWQVVPAFASQLIHPVSSQVFLIMLIEVTLIAAIFIYLGTVSLPNSIGMFLGMAMVNAVLLVNGLQHLISAIWLQTFTPGSITSILLLIPLWIYVMRQAWFEKQITRRMWAWSLLPGLVLFVPLIILSRSLAALLVS